LGSSGFGSTYFYGEVLLLIHTIPNKLTVSWNSNVSAVVAKWDNFFITFEEYSAAIIDSAINFGLNHSVRAWIIDASAAKGALHPDIVKLIETDVYPALVRCGIRNVLLIRPQFNALSKLTVASYTNKASEFGLNLVKVDNVTEAIKWLMLNKDEDDRWAN
jgi:hypothetical protein